MTAIDTTLIDRLGVVLEDLLAEVRHLRADLRERTASAASSVEIKTSTRGTDVSVKAYVGSDVSEAGDAAMDEYARVVADLNQRTLAAINGGTTA